MARRPISFETARRQYVHRYTLEHVPDWARKPCEGNGRFYAPGYATDSEWYEATTFPGENGHPRAEDHCISNDQTWPLGQWLRERFPGLHAVRQPGEPYDRVTPDMISRARERFGWRE